MNKYFLKDGSEVKIGDIVLRSCKITKDNIEDLILEGVIKEVKTYPTNFSYYKENLATKLGFISTFDPDFDVVYAGMRNHFPMHLLSMFLFLISKEMETIHPLDDNKYVYSVMESDGKILLIDKSRVNPHSDRALFATEDLAKEAISIIGDGIINELFGK